MDRLTEGKLAIYKQALKEQIAGLKADIAQLPYHPRYQPIAVADGPSGIRLRTDGPAEAHNLDRIIAGLEFSLARFHSDEAIKEVRAAMRDYRAADRMKDFFDLPF